jgi:hypothetical protein
MNDDFASVWDGHSLTLQRRLLQKTLAIADTLDISLFLCWGSLLGHVREGRILPWDDDVDLALFELGRAPALKAALEAEGLRTYDRCSGPETWFKVYDPGYPAIARADILWTWPNVDVFLYALDAHAGDGAPAAYPCEIILPGKITTFEGLRCREPEQPLALLDLQYDDWRDYERSPPYNHRDELWLTQRSSRRILTDQAGRKIAPP